MARSPSVGQHPLEPASTLVNRHKSGRLFAWRPLIFATLLPQVLDRLPDRVGNHKGDDITEETEVHAQK